MAKSKYDIWFCDCGRIHFYPKSDWDWMSEDHEHRRSIQVCRNCGALYEHFLTENGWSNKDGEPGLDLNGHSYHNEDRVTINEEDQIQRRWYIDKGIKVPMKEGGYADGHWSGIYFNADYMQRMEYPFDISKNCQHQDCITVDTNKLIKEVKRYYPEIWDDLLYSISGYIAGIDWNGTPYSYKAKFGKDE